VHTETRLTFLEAHRSSPDYAVKVRRHAYELASWLCISTLEHVVAEKVPLDDSFPEPLSHDRNEEKLHIFFYFNVLETMSCL
jgi:hypothetical protein